MTELFSQYTSGTQFSAGLMIGSATGISGLNPMVDRLNSISNDNGVVIGSFTGTSVSGTDLSIYGNFAGLSTSDGIDINAGSVISLTNKTSYWTCPGAAFINLTRDMDGLEIDHSNGVSQILGIGGVSLTAPIKLPNEAIVTACIVYGNAGATGETWTLNRINITTGNDDVMGGANIGTADTSITNGTISSGYSYFIQTSSLDDGDTIWGTKITYTTDYD